MRAALPEKGFPTFEEPLDPVRTARAMAWLGGRQRRTMAPPPAPEPLPPGPLDEAACRGVLEPAGIPFMPAVAARSAEEACAAVDRRAGRWC